MERANSFVNGGPLLEGLLAKCSFIGSDPKVLGATVHHAAGATAESRLGLSRPVNFFFFLVSLFLTGILFTQKKGNIKHGPFLYSSGKCLREVEGKVNTTSNVVL